MSSTNLQKISEKYVLFQSSVLGAYVDQVLKSPEFISKYDDLDASKKKKISDSRQKIMQKVLREEFDELVKENNITSEGAFYELIDSLDENNMEKKRRSKILSEVNILIK